MASGKGCQQPAAGKYWLLAVQEAVIKLPFRANIRTHNFLRFILEEYPVIVHIPLIVITFFDELAVAVHIDMEIFV